MMRALFTRFLMWLYKPFLTAILDNYDLRLREYLKLKFEHTESELECHDSRALSNIAQGYSELRAQIRGFQIDLDNFKKALAEQEIQNRADLAAWLTPKFQQLEARILRMPVAPNYEPSPPAREPREFTYEERQ